MSKVFGYPKFDKDGEMVLTTYENDYKEMMMDIRVYQLKPKETRVFCQKKEETAVLLLSGTLTFAWEEQKQTVSRKRRSLVPACK